MKKFKDPIYGYIDIPKELVHNVIDTPEFQRLRYIRQTSYLPVYPAALHNRFVHSIGVYFLGQKAFKSIKKSIEKEKIEIKADMERISNIFVLSCLLHDVGHAPFSHSGEVFYLDENKELYKLLIDTVNDQTFKNEIEQYHIKGKPAAPHEIMSVILGIKQFSSQFKDSEERSLFARCITGYSFTNSNNDIKLAFYNVLISLLNSSTIDVDRLDYLIRDAYVMGYNSISIDYQRLIEGMMLYKDSNNHVRLAYNKSALSVIENVIYAHDAEKKWIQNHPVILYEIFLIQQIIKEVNTFYKQKTSRELFSLESLLPTTNNTQEPNNGDNEFFPSMSLLCDDDIIYLSKIVNKEFCKELFDRNLRRHPIWKSESEYKVILDGYVGQRGYQDLIVQLEIFDKFLQEESPSHKIDKESQDWCNTQIQECKKSKRLSDRDKDNMLKRYTLLLRWLNCFKNIAKNQKMEFDFVLIQASNFTSSFAKSDLKDIQVFFQRHKQSYRLEELIELLSFKKLERDKFFYIYYSSKDKLDIDVKAIGKEIAKNVLQS